MPRYALVTGGARRVGAAVSRRLAAEGYAVVVHYSSSRKEAAALVRGLNRRRKGAFALQADLARVDEVRRLAAELVARGAVPELIVHNASIFYPTKLARATEADFDRFFAVHVKAPFFLVQALKSHLRRAKIVLVADWAGEFPYKDYLPYCVSKGALLTLTRALAIELAPSVQVNAILPGPVLLPEGIPALPVKKQTLLKRVGRPEDVAEAVAYLARADYSTGAFIHVDAGRHLWRGEG